MFLNQWEGNKARRLIVQELFDLGAGEIFVITADTESNPLVVYGGTPSCIGGRP